MTETQRNGTRSAVSKSMSGLLHRVKDSIRLNRTVARAVYTVQNWYFSRFGRLTNICLGPESSPRVAVCLRFRDEARYLSEWLDYHLAAGIDHFFLYNNNSKDEFREVLQPYLKREVVTLIDWPFAPASPAAEEDCIRRAMGRFKWVGFIDADEFVVIRDGSSIFEFLERYSQFAGVALHWYFFGSNGHKQRPETHVTEAYIRRRQHPDIHVKVFVQARYVTQCNNSHSWFFRDGKVAVNERKESVRGSRGFPPTGELAWINHYYTKSEQDYYEKLNQKTTLDISGMQSPSRTSERMQHHLTDNNDIVCLAAKRYWETREGLSKVPTRTDYCAQDLRLSDVE
jgi:Glycosyltransferase family 92